MPYKSSPYYPNKPLTYGSIYMFIKSKSYQLNPFDKTSIQEAKKAILQEARSASPNYKLFIKAATLSTGLSERSIKKLLYETTTTTTNN